MRGQIILGLVWCAAAVGSAFLGVLQESGGNGVAMALLEAHPVLAPESGRIASVSVVPGQTVSAGDVLAVVEIPGLTQELAAAEAELVAEGQVLHTDDADRARRFARDLDQLRAQLLSARVDLESERALLAGLESEVARQSAPGVAVSQSAVDAVKTQRDASKATVAAREAEIQVLERAVAAAGGRQAGSGNAGTASLTAAEAYRDALRARVESCTLRAYAPGTVGLVVPRPGQWVQAGLPVLQVDEATTGEAVAYVNPARAQRLAPGTTVVVHPESRSGSVVATIRSVGAAVVAVPLRQQHDPTVPEWGVPITLQIGDGVLTPGEVLAVEF
jgi:multidrug resistance efflux pump